jgi:hypothetical protein
MQKINLAEKLATFSDYFNPRVVGELNEQLVKLVKFQGELCGTTMRMKTNYFT